MSSEDAAVADVAALSLGAGAEAGEPKEKKLTAKELRILKKTEEAAAKVAQDAEAAAANSAVFGELPIIRSTEITGRVWVRVDNLDVSKVGQKVLVRARMFQLRETGKVVFIVLRQGTATVQAVVFKAAKDLFKFAGSVPKESVVDITGTVNSVANRVESVTQGDVELVIETLHIVSKANPVLPFTLEDAARSDTLYEAQEAEEAAALAAGGAPLERKYVRVNPDTRLDNRWIDLRTPANQAIMRISSGVCQLWREFLLTRNFVEIQSPKIIGGSSEGGSAIFTLKYFGDDACLAQSPQLYKQMAAACGDFERVFEIGPVFRAENSNTHRHLCEFHGLDLEMVINEHYFEVLDLFSEIFIYIFDGLNSRFKRELDVVRAQHPFEDLQYSRPSLRITYAEGVAMLVKEGVAITSGDDFSTAQEKALGAIIKRDFKTDFFMMDKYPYAVRPFYTMADPANPALSNSYDFFIRGEEILSGAQRVHDPVMLAKQAEEKGIRVSTIQSYVDSFKHGALPHGGGGVGLERVVMLFLGLGNIRKACLFPRDPKRLFP